MFQNYLKIALRNLARQKGYSAINIIGLAVGMACCLVMLLFVQDELSYDKMYSNAANIYRVTPRFYRGMDTAKGNTANANSQIALAPAMMRDLTGIKRAVRIFFYSGKTTLKYKNTMFAEDKILAVDKDYPQMFETKFLVGNPATALVEPYSVVLTDALARKYFGATTPFEQIIGKTIQIDNTDLYRITGIVPVPPVNTHARYDALLSFSSIEVWLKAQGVEPNNTWGLFLSSSTYVELNDGVSAASIEAQMPTFLMRYLSSLMTELRVKVHYPLQRLTDIHLNPTPGELQPQSSGTTVAIFGGVALFILAIACMNFMNLATARSQRRAREVGVRKVVGASRRQLVAQFLTEAIVISFFSLVLALVLVELVLPIFNSIVHKNLTVGYVSQPALVLGLIAAALITGVLAGSYPALALSGFMPMSVLKGRFATSRTGALVRKSLVAVQFTISIAMIIATIVVAEQLEYTRSKDLGLKTEQVIRLKLSGDSASAAHVDALKQAIRGIVGVVSVSATSYSPGTSPSQSGLNVAGETNSPNVIVAQIACDAAFVPTMQMKMAEGRNFSETNTSDKKEAFLLNESAVQALGITNPIGKKLVFGRDKSGTVIGIVKDFHYESLHRKIRPAIFMMTGNTSDYGYLMVKASGASTPQIIEAMSQLWRKTLPDRIFEFSFLDENFAKLYEAEQSVGSLIRVFAGLAIFIACLGLFGLAAFAAEVRTKEIGIRKVLGASAGSIVGLLSKDFLVLVAIGIAVACPLAWYGMNAWLQDFVYRIELTWWMFAFAGASSVMIAFITVAGQSWSAAQANPVQSLRSE